MARILIVDDERSYQEHLSRILERDGHDVRAAGDAETALALSSTFEADLLVVDWMLRDPTGGFRLAEQMQAQNAALRIIMISGYPDMPRSTEGGCPVIFAFLAKPFTLEEICDTVRRALDGPADG